MHDIQEQKETSMPAISQGSGSGWGGGGGWIVKGLAILIFKFERAHSTLNVGHIANLSNDGL